MPETAARRTHYQVTLTSTNSDLWRQKAPHATFAEQVALALIRGELTITPWAGEWVHTGAA
jgi:hypothetical protein